MTDSGSLVDLATPIDFGHTDKAHRDRDAKIDQIAEFMMSTRINVLPEGRDRRAVEKAACGRRCSDETWDAAVKRWRVLNGGGS